MHKTQFDHARFDFLPSSSDHMCFDQLSRETNAKHSDGAKAFGPLIVVACTP